jgi:hypothetical protein
MVDGDHNLKTGQYDIDYWLGDYEGRIVAARPPNGKLVDLPTFHGELDGRAPARHSQPPRPRHQERVALFCLAGHAGLVERDRV